MALQLLDRCLKIVDPELYAHLRSKNLSAEIYAFPCELFDVWFGYLPKCLFSHSRPDTLRMHPTPRPSSSVVGLFTCVWSPLERPLRYCAVITHEGQYHEFSEVCTTFRMA